MNALERLHESNKCPERGLIHLLRRII